MIILPDRNIVRTKVLAPIPASQWRTPSAAQPKNCFGHETQCRFTITARDRPHGKVIARYWYDDRDDCDAVLWGFITGAIRHDRHLQRLAARGERWGDIDPELLEEPIFWEQHTWWFLTGPVYPTTSTWSVPADCAGVSGQSGEFIDAIAGGGSGGGTTSSLRNCAGGGGPAWARITSLALTPSSSVNTGVATGGAAVSTQSNGNDGTDTWFNATSLSNAQSVGSSVAVAAEHGNAGQGGVATGTRTGGAAGTTANSVGTSKFAGGKGGDGSSGSGGSAPGGGGGGGPSGAGVAAANVSTSATGAGGNGNNSAGTGTGGAAGPNNGGAGQEYDASHGIGGGGGGSKTANDGGDGGNYGAGGGGDHNTGGVVSGAGSPGLIAMAYVAAATVPFIPASWSTPDFSRRHITYRYH